MSACEEKPKQAIEKERINFQKSYIKNNRNSLLLFLSNLMRSYIIRFVSFEISIRPIAIEISIIVTILIFDSDMKNGSICFIIY